MFQHRCIRFFGSILHKPGPNRAGIIQYQLRFLFKNLCREFEKLFSSSSTLRTAGIRLLLLLRTRRPSGVAVFNGRLPWQSSRFAKLRSHVGSLASAFPETLHSLDAFTLRFPVVIDMAGPPRDIHFSMSAHSSSGPENENLGKDHPSTETTFTAREFCSVHEEGAEGNNSHSWTFCNIEEDIDVDRQPISIRREIASPDGFSKTSSSALPSISELYSANTIHILNEAGNDDSSASDLSVVDPLLENVALQGFSRLKSRFQDPPSLTPAVMNQLTYCNSLVRRRASLSADLEVDGATPDVSVNTTASKEEPGQEQPVQENSDLANSLSKSKSSRTEQEEPDPFNDDFVPEEKKEKESKWILTVQWCSLFILTALLISSVEIHILENVLFLGLSLWRWQALALVILCGHLISGWIMKLFVSLIEKHYLLKKKVLYFVYGLRHCVKNSIWLALVVGVWGVIFQGHEDTTAVNIVSKTLWCIFTASVSWMIKVLVVKVAASNFHRMAYFDKIQECLFNQYLLEKLSGPPIMIDIDLENGSKSSSALTRQRKQQRSRGNSLKKTQSEIHLPQITALDATSSFACKRTLNSRITTYWSRSCRRFGSEKSMQKESSSHSVIEVDDTSVDSSTTKPDDLHFVSPISNLGKSAKTIQHEKLQCLTSETVSVWTLKKLMKIVRNTNLRTYSSMLSHEKQQTFINSEAQAKAVAKQIYHNMTRPGQKCITITNFLYFLEKEQAFKAFGMFQATETGEITKQAFAKWVVNAYKERRALCLTLNDNKTIIEKLHTVLNGVLAVILVAAFVLIFGVDTSKVLLFVSSIILPSVFMFGNAAKILFESLIFLFVTHPFDVGDRISVDGQTMLVEEMNILHTILLSTTNEKIYYPNFLLAAKPISNYYRSPDQWDSIDYQIHMKTPLEKLTMLKDRLQKHVESLPQHWYPEFRMACKDIEDSTKMKMSMWIRHRLNFQEGGERFQRRSNLLFYLKQQLEELDISYQLPRQEIIVTGVPATHLDKASDF